MSAAEENLLERLYSVNMEWRVIPLQKRNAETVVAMNHVLYENVGKKLSPPTIAYHLWEPTVSLARYQSVEDVDFEACRKLGFKVVRTITGGRAVIHFPDIGFTYTVAQPTDSLPNRELASKSPQVVYKYYLGKVVDALKSLGINAELVPPERNSLRVNGRKLSGNAQKIGLNAVLQEGLILYDKPNVEVMLQLVKIYGMSYEEARSYLEKKITYVREHREDVSLQDVCGVITREITSGNFAVDGLTKDEEKQVKVLEERYKDPHWHEGHTMKVGLCWLPSGEAPVGSLRGVSPDDEI